MAPDTRFLDGLRADVASLEACEQDLASMRLQPESRVSASAARRRNDTVTDLEETFGRVCERLCSLSPKLTAREATREAELKRGYEDQLYQAKQALIDQYTSSRASANKRGDDLQARLDVSKDDVYYLERDKVENEATIRDLQGRMRSAQIKEDQLISSAAEKEMTVTDLRVQLSTANRQLNALAAAPKFLAPSWAGERPRSSNDSGFYEGSSATNEADKTRQTDATGLVVSGLKEYGCGAYRNADEYFAKAQRFIRGLPVGLRANFDNTSLAYYRAVCSAESDPEESAKKRLRGFLEGYDRATTR